MAEQTYLSVRQTAFLDAFLISLPSKIDHSDLPSLREDVQGIHDVVVQDVHHVIPGLGVVAENGDAANEQILHDDHLATEAVRTILHLEIVGNCITVKHYRWIVKRLRDGLLQASPRKIPHGEAYARILKRLAERLTTVDSKSALALRPLDYVECLDKLLENMERGFVIMKQTGLEDDVFIIEDEELVGYSERLFSLASQLRGDY